MLFKELSSGAPVTEYRRGLQNTFVAGLTGYFKQATADATPRAAVLATLRDLRKRLESHTGNAHFDALADAIDRALKKD